MGIGTSSPNNYLDVRGSAAFGGGAGGPLPLANSAYFSGNVGIGTTGPGYKLQIVPADAGQVWLGNPSDTATYTGGFVAQGPDDGSSPEFIGYSRSAANAATSGITKFIKLNTQYSNDLAFIGTGASTKFQILTGLTNADSAWASGNVRVTVDTSGNVGIGTASPLSLLDVSGNTLVRGNIGIGTTAPTQALDIQAAVANLTFSSAVGNHQIITGGSTNLALMPGGNVGIGTTGPGQKLEVVGNVQLGVQNYLYSKLGAGTASPIIGIGSDDYTTIYSTGSSYGINFLSAANAKLVTITNAGNVGIGTTNPLFKLDVNGTANIAGALTTTGNIVPNTDNTYDLGTTSLRWKTLHVGPASLVVHNDATDTLKATLGFTGNRASLLTNATTAFWLATGTNQGIFQDTSGNVGVGTTSPSANLHVIGQCVTGDTLLKRRRRKKGKNGEWIDEWENVRIDQIKPNDEIQTLNEQTGKFVVSKVNALMDMGVKQTFLLTTESGKSIRTTANHPYLVETERPIPDSNFFFEKYFSEILTVAKEFYFGVMVGQEVAVASFEDGVKISRAGWEHLVHEKDRSNLNLISRLFALPKVIPTLICPEAIPTYEQKGISEFWAFQAIVDGVLTKVVVRSINGGKKHFYSVMWQGEKREIEEAIKTIEEVEKEKGAVSRLYPRCRGVVTPQLQEKYNTFAKDLSNLEGSGGAANLSNGRWTKVSALKTGDRIAVTGRNASAIFEKIVRIEHQKAEKVFDIEVEGTHNFVGNGIVAHNTYLRGSGTGTGFSLRTADSAGTDRFAVLDNGNVGIGTTGPGGKLEVAGGNVYFGNNYALGWRDTGGAVQNILGVDNSDKVFFYPANSSGVIEFRNWAGTPNVLIQQNGNVGIGTTGPDVALSIYTTSDATANIKVSRSGQVAQFGVSNAAPTYGAGIWFAGTQAAHFYGGGLALGSYVVRTPPSNGLVVSGNVGIGYYDPGTAALAINGNVGIGTTGPIVNLDVRSAASANAGINLQPTTGTFSPYYRVENTAGVSYFGRENSAGGLLITGSTAYATIFGSYSGTQPVQLAVNNSVKMTIQNDGNVGIGTASPLSLLDVSGNALVRGNIGIGTTAPTQALDIQAAVANLTFSSAVGNHQIITGGSTNLALMPGGNVGIGTTGPLSPLDILSNSAGETLRLRERSAGTGTLKFTASDGTTARGRMEWTSSALAWTLDSQNMTINGGNVGIGT
ncbi:hypothetical protein HYW61_01860, partial [candidate division WWE3 bacterium]|nr:hypothetical protein [candidate division WWE3 bacterium]